LPFLSMPDQLKGTSRLMVFAPVVATAVAMFAVLYEIIRS
jgi:hypothetical protein